MRYNENKNKNPQKQEINSVESEHPLVSSYEEQETGVLNAMRETHVTAGQVVIASSAKETWGDY
jgi:hypothetical protein